MDREVNETRQGKEAGAEVEKVIKILQLLAYQCI